MVENKGEFERRIRELTFESKPLLLDIDDVLEIVEEAKKEFPFRGEFKSPLTVQLSKLRGRQATDFWLKHKDEIMDEIAESQRLEMFKWFEKWFGNGSGDEG